MITREDSHDVRVGDWVRGNGVRTYKNDGPAAPGLVVMVDSQYVHLMKPTRAGGSRRVRVRRTAVWADGKNRRTGYTVTAEADR